ncbi:MAG TPA: hypothetical protein VK195_18510 [Burkholderiaceae bacterium]|nr:hypothetical protein [Burkholderiaceae bacterium]
MFELPESDVEHWRQRLRQDAPAKVLREMTARYSVGRSAIGLVLPDLGGNVRTAEVQAVWTWDVAGTGAGLTDEELNDALKDVQF